MTTTKTSTTGQPIGRFHGVIPAMPTPLTKNHEVDEEAIRRIVYFLIRNGVHGLWILGTGSGFPALTSAQRRQSLQAVLQANQRRVPTIVGVSDTSLDQSIANAQEAAALGADAVSSLAPYYYSLDAIDIQRFFEGLADASPVPLILYHNPFNSKIPLDLKLIDTLSQHERIAGIKDSTCSIGFHLELLAQFRDREDFCVIQGDDGAMAAAPWHGADAIVAATPVFAPALVVQLFEAAKSGDTHLVRSIQNQCTDLLNVFTVRGSFNDSNFLAGQHAALEAIELCSRTPPRPCRSYTDSEIQSVKDILARNGILRRE